MRENRGLEQGHPALQMTVRHDELAIWCKNPPKRREICIKTVKEQRNTLTEQRESCTIEHVVNNGVHATRMGMLPAFEQAECALCAV